MISIVIPTLNEELNLPHTLQALVADRSTAEVIVVDAGSTDRTVEVAERFSARFFHSVKRKRGAQMNLGAGLASGDVLLFLHADTVMLPGALAAIEPALARDPTIVGGGFARRFSSRSLFLRATCLLAELRSRSTGWFLGDQAMFIRSTAFHELGGFCDMEIFEDLDLSRRMVRAGRTVTLRPGVISSARRFELKGPWRTTYADFKLTWKYLRENKHRTARELRLFQSTFP